MYDFEVLVLCLEHFHFWLLYVSTQLQFLLDFVYFITRVTLYFADGALHQSQSSAVGLKKTSTTKTTGSNTQNNAECQMSFRPIFSRLDNMYTV